jgi:hypothetical protein
MPIPLPNRPNVRRCTHIKVTGQRCCCPALRHEFFCYFHTRVIKGVQQRVDMQLHSMALLEDCESIQLSLMHVVDGLVRGTLEPVRARLIIQALRIAARNAKNVRFDTNRESEKQSMVREVPNYAQQYLIEHPEAGPPINGNYAAAAPASEAATNPVIQLEAQAEPQSAQQNASQKSTITGIDPAPKERKNPGKESADDNEPVENSEEYAQIQQAQAAIPGALAGNWRDLRTVFEFAGISERHKATASELDAAESR